MASSYYSNDESNDDYSISEYESIPSQAQRNTQNKKKGGKFIPADKRGTIASCYTVHRNMGEDGKLKKIRLFNSCVYTNAPIINAVTGLAYYSDGNLKYKIGSAQEDDLFKVRFLTREGGIPGLTLFYDSPDQYERHLGCIVNSKIKEKHHLKQKKWLHG
jgi:hypothetical protein